MILSAILSSYEEERTEAVLRYLLGALRKATKTPDLLKKYLQQLIILSRLRNLEQETIKAISDMVIEYDVEQDYLYKMGIEKGIARERERMQQEMNLLEEAKAILEEERLRAEQERMRIIEEKKAAEKEKERIAQEKVVAEQEKERIAQEKEAAKQEKARIAAEKAVAEQEKAQSLREKEEIQQKQITTGDYSQKFLTRSKGLKNILSTS
ncbi:MAG: hypothetical protein AAF849_03890 [Bacteroidota bacterium]